MKKIDPSASTVIRVGEGGAPYQKSTNASCNGFKHGDVIREDGSGSCVVRGEAESRILERAIDIFYLKKSRAPKLAHLLAVASAGGWLPGL